MERLATDRLVFHHSCFRCKRCRLKLNLLNFVPVQDEFYCRAHYDRQCKAKHNYIEDFDLNHCEELLLSKNTNCSQTENNLQIEENGKLEDAKGKLDLVPNAVQPNLEGVGRISEPAERSKSGMKNSTRSVPIAKLRISWPPPKTAD
ncbi:LIM domain and actin-binding protein 1-like [Pristis pectinata]|uniref:LIM domain and actin-binding protein 1-like n=1 Tax=Pristis pectinata TaxID=685728 RepID=UPI00223D1939|nr:LIM domain and actin-binding protein 1-like [Pristis pectinata]